MHTSKLTKCLTLNVIFYYHLVSWCKLQLHTIGETSNLSVSIDTGYQVRRSTQGQLKITRKDFVILNSHVPGKYSCIYDIYDLTRGGGEGGGGGFEQKNIK